MHKKYLTILFASTLLWSCSDKKEPAPAANATSPLTQFLLPQPPAAVQQISAVFADPTPGREVVLAGEIMGRKDPFVPDRGIVVLGDPTKITPCNRIPGDNCPTPWDNCCDDPGVLKKSITTVQFLDKEGKIIKTGLKGFQGIKELSFLTIKGKIAEGSNAENLLINAEGFCVTDPSPYLNAAPVSDYSDPVGVVEKDDELIFTKEPAKK